MTELAHTVRTSDLPERERFDFWRHAISQAFFPAEVTRRHEGDGDGFRGQIRGASLGMLHIHEVDAEPCISYRTPQLIAAGSPGYYKVGLQLSGSSVLSQAGRETQLRVGDFVVYDVDRPHTLTFNEPYRLLVLLFPHDMLGLPAERMARLAPTPISGREGLGALIVPFLVRVAGVLDDLDPNVGVRLAGNVLDLLATVLAERLDTAPGDPSSTHRALLVRIMAFIEWNLGDPKLSPDLIAAAHHISTRQLHKMFRSQGRTVSAWIRHRRLERCRRDLRDPLQRSRTVSTIAARWGFLDAAHFSRLFKATFGLTPREYRMTAAQMTGGAPGPLGAVLL